jgi:hypothetical protein
MSIPKHSKKRGPLLFGEEGAVCVSRNAVRQTMADKKHFHYEKKEAGGATPGPSV